MAITNAQLALQISEFVDAATQRDQSFEEWMFGAVGGGPNLDGRYPLSDYLGNILYVKSPAQLEEDVSGVVNSALSYRNDAQTSATEATEQADRATTEADRALLYKNDAQASQQTSENILGDITNIRNTIQVWYTEVENNTAIVEQAQIDVTALRDETLGYRDESLTYRNDAEYYATQAATFNPANYAPIVHSHSIADVTSLQTTLDGKSNVGHGHVIGDVSGLQTALDDKASSSHTHGWSDILNPPVYTTRWAAWDEVTNKPLTFAPAAHTHAIADVTGLQTALDGKVSTSLLGAPNGVATLDANGYVPSTQLPSYVDDVLEFTSQASFPASGESGKLYLALDTGSVFRWTGATYLQVNNSVSSADTADRLATGRTISLSGGVTGSVVFDGSANVTINATVTDDSHAHLIADVDGLQTALNGKAPLSHTHAWADITSGVPDTATRWPTWSEVTSKPSTFTPSAHTHAWTDITSGVPETATRWPTWAEVTSKPTTFTPSAHTHAIADVTGLQTALDDKLNAIDIESRGLTSTASTSFGAVWGQGLTGFRIGRAYLDADGPTGSNYDIFRYYHIGDGTRDVVLAIGSRYTGSLGKVYSRALGDADSGWARHYTTKDKPTLSELGIGMLSSATNNTIKVTSSSGWVEIGPKNTSWCHFNTDRPSYYFDKGVAVNGTLTRYGDSRTYGTTVVSTGTPSGGSSGDIWFKV